MSDELAYLNLVAARADFKPIVAEGGEGVVAQDSDFVIDVENHEDLEGESVSKKRHDSEGGERSPSPTKSKGDVVDPGETAVGSTGVVVVQTPPSPSHLTNVDQILSSFRGLSFPIASPAE
ncbi:hypothetical protein A2U01_0058403, partial [Trifolium medium]|nr:hypothetical protein [Trifolium medium]